MKTHKNFIRRGFTMIELLVVIAIIAILSGIGFGTFILLNKSAAEKKTKIVIENVHSQLTRYVSEGGELPDGNGGIGSTEVIVRILSGNDPDGSGNDVDRIPLLAQADPEYSGEGKMVDEIDGVWVLIDGFGNEIFYRGPNSTNRVNNFENGFDLWSDGADGSEEAKSDKDDITNW